MADGREGGFIKLHRRLKSWPLWQHMTALQRMVVVEILLSANWKERDAWLGKVGRGELAQSEETIAKEAKVSRKVVRQAISLLMAEGFLARREAVRATSEGAEVGIESGGDRAAVGNEKGRVKGRNPNVITVLNYEKYQGDDDEEGPIKGQRRASEGPAKGQRRAPLEEGEEGEEGEELKQLLPDAASRAPGEEPTLTLPGCSSPVPSEPKPKRRKAPKKASETDPRFAPLRSAWEAEFQAATGAEYRWSGAADAAGVHRVIAVPVEEFRERAHKALVATGYLRCGSLARLTGNEVWNQLAGACQSNGTAKRRVISDPSDFSRPENATWDS